jgi:acyl-coenzyme A thioesterase PaaI-like protein
MDITDIAFNRLIGLQREPAGGKFSVSLPASSLYHNHLGIVHAAALFAVAEAASGDWMLTRFGGRAAEFVAVVRRAEMKYRKPARGKILGRARADDAAARELEAGFATKRMMLFTLVAEVFDESGAHNLTASIEWFITRREPARGA